MKRSPSSETGPLAAKRSKPNALLQADTPHKSKLSTNKEFKPKFEKKVNNEKKTEKKKKVKPNFTEITEESKTKSKAQGQAANGANKVSKFGKKIGLSPHKKILLKKKGGKTFQEIPTKLLGKDGKPKWADLKQEKKKLKEDRKTRKSGEEMFKLMAQAKLIWEKLRRRDISQEMKEAYVNELFMMLKSEIPNVVHSHDLTRVVQWMLKLGSPAVKTSICEALSANTVKYLQSKFASYCVKRALHYGSKTDRRHLIQSCKGNFLKLLSHSYASQVLEEMYSKYASSDQRKQMHKEIYGEMHQLLPPEVTSIEKIPDDLKSGILAATKANLTKLLAKKHLLKFTLLLSVLNDYLASCSPQDCNDIVELIHGDILELLDTKEGSRVALQVIWHATNKMKKAIVKKCKGMVKETATSEVGHIVLLGLFDCIDDTVLVKKALIPELLNEAEELAKDEWGRKVILYLVAHRDPKYFHPQQIAILAKGDSISSRKKDTCAREQEMLEAVSGPLLQKIADDPSVWLGDNSVAMVSLAVMKSGTGEPLQAAFESVVSYLLDPSNFLKVDDRQFHIVEHSALHLVFKKLIAQDQAQPDKTKESFSKVLATRLTETSLNHILQFNRGCFLLTKLLESNNKKVCKIVKSKITDTMKKFLQKQETTGSKILLSKLKKED